MNTTVARGFSLGELSYIDPSFNDDAIGPLAAVKEHRVAIWFARQFARIGEWQRRRAVMQELAMMSDRELSDIGLSRSDFARVFDPAFAADHAHGRDYIAY